MTDSEPAWRRLHSDWWLEQRTPKPGDVELAWEVLWDVIPPNHWQASPR